MGWEQIEDTIRRAEEMPHEYEAAKAREERMKDKMERAVAQELSK